MWCAGLEQLSEFGVFIDWTHGFNEAGPVGGVQKLFLAVLFENLRYDDELVVNTLPLLSLLLTMGSEIEKVVSFDLVNVGLGAEFLEGLEDGTIGRGSER